MARRRATRDMTIDEFDRWAKASADIKDTMEVTAEEGGPRVSFVPEPRSVPLDFLPDEVQLPAVVPPPGVVPFKPEPSRKVGGWNATQQRLYIETLAETGSVHLSAKAAGRSARSAYALRVRSPAFSAAWDAAQQLAVGRLSALAFDRAIHGRVEQVSPGRARRGKARAERAPAYVAAKPPRSQALRLALGTREEPGRRPAGGSSGGLPGAARQPRRCRRGIGS